MTKLFYSAAIGYILSQNVKLQILIQYGNRELLTINIS